MKITFYGQSCFLFKSNGKSVLVDPFFEGNKHAEGIDWKSIECDYILLSHGHGDHVAQALAIAKRTNAMIISTYEVATWFSGKMGYTNVHDMNHGGKRDFEFGTLKWTNAVHSSTMPDGSSGGTAAGMIIWAQDKTFYFAGDTALHLDMKLIPMWAKLDFCILPIGDNYTMGYEDAAVAAEFVDCKTVVGVHYDTFGYIVIDQAAALAHFKENKRELVLPIWGTEMEF